MAMSPAERKRLQVKRERDNARMQLDLTYSLPRKPLGAWLSEGSAAENLQHLNICYDGMNRQAPDFDQDTDPVSASGDFEFPMTGEGALSYRGALGRAELEVDLLIEAAKTLASMINAYKRDIITDRLEQIETHELSDPDTRSEKIKEVIGLTKALERLEKSVRADIPQWLIRG